MEKNLEMKEIESAMEGILFASGEPVAIDRICLALDIDRATAELVLQKLSDYYAYERARHPSRAHGGELPALLRAGVCRRHPPGL